ncbi:MAG: hypothetical protein H0V79_03770 [Actinobacteria bacterium]|nr:hypothetical protein [Actinomycetota bacterium]
MLGDAFEEDLPEKAPSEASRIAYDVTLTNDEKREKLEELAEREPFTDGEVRGYFEMLSMLDSADRMQFGDAGDQERDLQPAESPANPAAEDPNAESIDPQPEEG